MGNTIYLDNYCGPDTKISKIQLDMIVHGNIGSAIRSGVRTDLINSLMSNSRSLNKVARSF